MGWRWLNSRWARLGAGAVVALLLIRLWPHEPLRERLGVSTPIYSRSGELMRLTLAADQQYRLWTPLEQMSPVLVDSVLLYEDRAFWWHPGVNPLALARSLSRMLQGGRREGASTISMQLARRLERIDSRQLAGKLHQMAAALWLEARYSKRQILEAYLNSTPYGGNIEGVGAASLIYFNRSAGQLTLGQALTLAVIPQNPSRRLASRASGPGGNADLEAARSRLGALWRARHPQHDTAQAADVALRLPAFSRGNLPFSAPHLTDMLLASAGAGWSGGDGAGGASSGSEPAPREPDGAIHTTIDLPMQRTLERVMKEYLRGRQALGLRNASALLLDAAAMEVRAVVGSADYADPAIHGQVNGTLGKRSPGSTLKPFIYALALDQGLIHPRTILKDAPTAFGPFTPENFDGHYVGPLAAQDALTRSRNVPAVALAARLSQPNLYQFLQLSQISRLESEAHYGLALVLGGGEVTPEELARMYAVLVNRGELRPMAYTRAQAQAFDSRPATRLLSPEAAFITLDMLRQTPRPDTGGPAKPAVAWKTGTSWGFRDAWTAGAFGRHVLVVWVGNFDGEGNPAFVGIDAAAPLFLRIVDALRAQGLDVGELVSAQPPDLRRVEVCTATGGPPAALCPARTQTWFIAGKSPIKGSALHRAAWLDSRTGKASCARGPGAPASSVQPIVVEQWGSDMQALFRESGLPRRTLEAGDCAAESAAEGGDAPIIASPLRGVRYQLSNRKRDALQLRADAAAGVKTLYWFAGDGLIGRSAPGESISWRPPGPGNYVLRVVDDRGRVESRALAVDAQP